MQRINHLISLVSALLVLFLAGSAFFLSFESLRNLAVQIGIAEQIAWLYPAIIDGAIVVFSLSVLRADRVSLGAGFCVHLAKCGVEHHPCATGVIGSVSGRYSTN